MPDIRLVIAGGTSGTDEYVGHLKEMAHKSERILFTGYVTGKEKEELLSNARLFVLPSELEGLPIALLEAMSYGLPCLASNIPPHREVIRDGVDGFLFQHDDLSDCVLRLRNLIEHPLKFEGIGDGAKAKVKKEYDWDDVVQRTEEVYQDVMGITS